MEEVPALESTEGNLLRGPFQLLYVEDRDHMPGMAPHLPRHKISLWQHQSTHELAVTVEFNDPSGRYSRYVEADKTTESQKSDLVTWLYDLDPCQKLAGTSDDFQSAVRARFVDRRDWFVHQAFPGVKPPKAYVPHDQRLIDLDFKG
jgi:hypothetical protein